MSAPQTAAAGRATEALKEAIPPGDSEDGELPRRRPKPTHYFMVVPTLALFCLFIVYPAVQGAIYSFTNNAGYGEWHFIGWANYVAMFQDPTIGQSYGFTLLYAATTTIVMNLIALFLAVLLNSKTRWPSLWKGIYFIPMVLSGLVVAYCFRYLLSLSLPNIINWGVLGDGILANEDWAWTALVMVSVWAGFPGTVIIYLAGLSSIGGEIYEAGELDGAGAGGQFRYLTLPLLAPFVIINTVLGLKNYLGMYDLIVGLTDGGPAGATQSVAMQIVDTLNNSDVAYGTASAMLFFIITIALSVAQLGVVKLMGGKS